MSNSKTLASVVSTGAVLGSINSGVLLIPTGSEAQRPGTPATGMFRFNSDNNSFEGYNGTLWGAIGGGGGADGGFANSVYLNSQTIDGGNASG